MIDYISLRHREKNNCEILIFYGEKTLLLARSAWQLRYQQLEQARNCSGSIRQEQLNIIEKTLKIVKRDIIFITTLKFVANCFGMLLVSPMNVTRSTTTNETIAVQDILKTLLKNGFYIVSSHFILWFGILHCTKPLEWLERAETSKAIHGRT